MHCKSNTIYGVSRDDIALGLVGLDFLAMISLWIALQMHEGYENDEVEEIEGKMITGGDFTIKYMNLPPHDNLTDLKIEIWKHLEMVPSRQRPQLKRDEKFPSQLVSLHFGLTDYGAFFYQKNEGLLLKQRRIIEKKKEKAGEGQYELYDAQIAKVNKKIEKNRFALKLYEENNHTKGVAAYATFQSMEGQMRAIKAFNKGKCSRCCTLFCCRRKSIDYKYFKGTWPIVDRASEPSIIKWENLHIGKCGRCWRILFVSLISLILMAVSFTVIILAKDYETQMRNEFKANDCQSTNITPEEAETDHSLPVDD